MKKINKRDLIYIPIISLLIIAVLIVSFVLNKPISQSYYDKKCNSFAVQNTNLSKGQIIFIGDSITDLYPLDSYYSDLSVATDNRGIGGDTTEGVLKRLQVSLFDLAPSKIVLMIGVNDIYTGRSIDETYSNYEKILSQIETNLPEAKVYCMSVISQNETLNKLANFDITANISKIISLNQKIKSLTETKTQLKYIDLFTPTSTENNMLINSYSDDGIHLNANGFNVWTSILKPLLQH